MAGKGYFLLIVSLVPSPPKEVKEGRETDSEGCTDGRGPQLYPNAGLIRRNKRKYCITSLRHFQKVLLQHVVMLLIINNGF